MRRTGAPASSLSAGSPLRTGHCALSATHTESPCVRSGACVAGREYDNEYVLVVPCCVATLTLGPLARGGAVVLSFVRARRNALSLLCCSMHMPLFCILLILVRTQPFLLAEVGTCDRATTRKERGTRRTCFGLAAKGVSSFCYLLFFGQRLFPI